MKKPRLEYEVQPALGKGRLKFKLSRLPEFSKQVYITRLRNNEEIDQFEDSSQDVQSASQERKKHATKQIIWQATTRMLSLCRPPLDDINSIASSPDASSSQRQHNMDDIPSSTASQSSNISNFRNKLKKNVSFKTPPPYDSDCNRIKREGDGASNGQENTSKRLLKKQKATCEQLLNQRHSKSLSKKKLKKSTQQKSKSNKRSAIQTEDPIILQPDSQQEKPIKRRNTTRSEVTSTAVTNRSEVTSTVVTNTNRHPPLSTIETFMNDIVNTTNRTRQTEGTNFNSTSVSIQTTKTASTANQSIKAKRRILAPNTPSPVPSQSNKQKEIIVIDADIKNEVIISDTECKPVVHDNSKPVLNDNSKRVLYDDSKAALDDDIDEEIIASLPNESPKVVEEPIDDSQDIPPTNIMRTPPTNIVRTSPLVTQNINKSDSIRVSLPNNQTVNQTVGNEDEIYDSEDIAGTRLVVNSVSSSSSLACDEQLEYNESDLFDEISIESLESKQQITPTYNIQQSDQRAKHQPPNDRISESKVLANEQSKPQTAVSPKKFDPSSPTTRARLDAEFKYSFQLFSSLISIRLVYSLLFPSQEQ